VVPCLDQIGSHGISHVTYTNECNVLGVTHVVLNLKNE
jgi:hypothetical protein